MRNAKFFTLEKSILKCLFGGKKWRGIFHEVHVCQSWVKHSLGNTFFLEIIWDKILCSFTYINVCQMFVHVLNALSTYRNQYTQCCATVLDYHTPKSSNNIQYQIFCSCWKFKRILKFPCPTSYKCYGNESYWVILKIPRIR